MKIKKFNLFVESLQSEFIDIVPHSVKDLHKLFRKNGKRLYVVGGAVRDFLMGKKPKDFDLATNATPDEVLEILSNDFRTNIQGKAFGVVVVYTEDQPIGMEIATFRSDVYDGSNLGKTRNPEVKFSTIEDDVIRRDLTINGLFFNLDTNEIVDLVGGVEDIKNKKIVMIGDPELRIKEDPLRILRAIRSACKFGDESKINELTKEAIRNNVDKLEIISKERIWEEIKKAFGQAKDFNIYLKLLNEFNIFEFIFPKTDINNNFVESNNLSVIFANIFKNNDTTKLYNILVLEYKIESDLVKRIIFLINFLNFTPENVFDFYKFKQQSGISDFEIKEWIDILELDNNWMIKFLNYAPTISAQELMNNGFKGVQLGNEIKRLEIAKFKKE